jgi:hypothetical protein
MERLTASTARDEIEISDARCSLLVRLVRPVEYPAADGDLAGLWICPRCGARLPSRNLWHSCGTFTLEDLFAKSSPAALQRGCRSPMTLSG